MKNSKVKVVIIFREFFGNSNATYYNKLSCKKKMKWHPLMIRFALNLRYLSNSAYNAVGKFLSLPTQRTLRDYTHFTSFQTGVSHSVILKLKEDMQFSSSSPSQRKVIILMDEMKIKSDLVFNKGSKRLIGFVNLGEVNNDLESLRQSLIDEKSSPKQPDLAESMLVMMVRTIFKPSFNFPLAQYPTSSLSGEKLYSIVWEVIEALELNNIQVHAVSCDGLSANRNFFRKSSDSDNTVPFKTQNPLDLSRCIYFFCDVPHLLKTTRNCFSNSFAHANSRFLKVYNYNACTGNRVHCVRGFIFSLSSQTDFHFLCSMHVYIPSSCMQR